MMKKHKRAFYIGDAALPTKMHIGLCINEKQLRKEMKILKSERKIDTKIDFPAPGRADTWFFQNPAHKTVCLILFNSSADLLIERHGLLLHEAVHVWQHILEEAGEDKPGNEIEAYAIQQIYINLVSAYHDMVGAQICQSS